MDDAAIHQHVDMIGHDIIEQALIMGDQQRGTIWPAHRIDAIGNNAQRIDVEAGIGLIEHGKEWLQHVHLHHLVALLLAARKTLVHGALHHVEGQAQFFGRGLGQLHEFRARRFRFAAQGALGVERRAQEQQVRNAGDLHRILQAQEQTGSSAFVRRLGQQILTAEGHRTAGHFIAGAAGQNIGQGGFAGAVWPHDSVHFTGIHGQCQALQDGLAINFGGEIVDNEHLGAVLNGSGSGA